jgi:hypothetical protein
MPYSIEYWTNAPDDVYPSVLEVSSAKGAELLVASNEDEPGEPTIGRFAMRGDAAAFTPLLDAVTAPGFAAAGAPAMAEPGELIRRFSVTVDSKSEVVRVVTETMKPDAPFAAAESLALQLMKKVRQHPRRVLALENFALNFSAVMDRLEVTFSLANPGPEPVAIPYLVHWAQANIQLTVTARRSDVPLAQMGNQHQVFVQFDADQLVELTAPSNTGNLLVLAPGQELRLRFQKDLPPLMPGKYDVWGTFSVQLLDAKGSEITRGELASPRQPVQWW